MKKQNYLSCVIVAFMFFSINGCFSNRTIGNNYTMKDVEPMQLKIVLRNNEIVYLENIIDIKTIEEYIAFVDNRLGEKKILLDKVKDISVREFDLIKLFLNTFIIVGGILLLLYLIIFSNLGKVN